MALIMTNIRLSNIPPELGKAIKIAAAKSGVTITEFVIECVVLELSRRDAEYYSELRNKP